MARDRFFVTQESTEHPAETQADPVENAVGHDDIDWESTSTASSRTEPGDNGALLSASHRPDSLLPLRYNHLRNKRRHPSKLMGNIPPLDLETDRKFDDDKKSPEDDEDAVPEVIIEKHILGQNDKMSGGLSHPDAWPPTVSERHVHSQCASDPNLTILEMPYKVIRRHELFRLNLPLEDIRNLYQFPFGFLTTYRGVELALEEVGELDTDDALLEAIWKRGGFCRSEVVYPENIIPTARREENGEWEEGFDEDYWFELQAQGKIWDEIHVP